MEKDEQLAARAFKWALGELENGRNADIDTLSSDDIVKLMDLAEQYYGWLDAVLN